MNVLKKMFLGAYRIEKKKTTLGPSALELDLTLHLGVWCWKKRSNTFNAKIDYI